MVYHLVLSMLDPARENVFMETGTNLGSKAINHNPNELLPTQDLDQIYQGNSNVHILERTAFFDQDARITSQPMMWEMDQYEAVDIDEEQDLRMAEALSGSVKRLDGENSGLLACLWRG